MNQILIGFLAALVLALGVGIWWFRKAALAAEGENTHLKARYGPFISVDVELAKVSEELTRKKGELGRFVAEAERQRADLKKQYDTAHSTYESLKREVSTLEENLEDISFGLYKPHFSFQHSDEHKKALGELRDKERELIHEGRAAVCPRK